MGVHRFAVREAVPEDAAVKPHILYMQDEIELFIEVSDHYDGTLGAAAYVKASDLTLAPDAAAVRYSAVRNAANGEYTIEQDANGEFVLLAGTMQLAADNTYIAPGTLVIRKKLTADSAVPPAPAAFTIEITLEPPQGVALNTSYQTNRGEAVTIANNQFTVELAPDESVAVLDLPVGTKLTAIEKAMPYGYTLSEISWKDGSSVIAADHSEEVTVFNSYQPQPVIAGSGISLDVVKTLTGRPWLAGDSFSFKLELLDSVSQTPVAQWTKSTGGVPGSFAPVRLKDFTPILQAQNFKAAGSYYYRLTEITPDQDARLNGITYANNSAVFRLDVEDRNGQLVIANVESIQACTVTPSDNGDRRAWHIEVPFTNTYAIDPLAEAEVSIPFQKRIVDAGGSILAGHSLTGYQFNLYEDTGNAGRFADYHLAASAVTGADGRFVFALDALNDVGVQR